MDLGLDGRIALVTGAAGGIGRAVAVRLAAEGCRLVLVDRHLPDASGLDPDRVLATAADVTDESAIGEVVEAGRRRSAAPAVVLVASDSALVASPGMVPYCASKAAVVQLARAASVDLAPVRVVAVCPSVVDTPMSRADLGVDPGVAGGFDDRSYPVQTAGEVAATIAFLCSPLARAVSGTALVSDFGYSARSGFPA